MPWSPPGLGPPASCRLCAARAWELGIKGGGGLGAVEGTVRGRVGVGHGLVLAQVVGGLAGGAETAGGGTLLTLALKGDLGELRAWISGAEGGTVDLAAAGAVGLLQRRLQRRLLLLVVRRWRREL